MKYAWYPGCVSQGACPELFKATLAVADKLDIELVELKEAACTGAGILSERNPELSDTLNARTFAMAEKLGLPLMTICSTCQGVMSQANYKLQNDPDYLAKVNETLALEGLEYKGTTKVSHLLWVIVEDIGLDKVEPLVTRPLTGVKIAPFYGCYILRPTMYLGFEDQPERDTYIEKITTTLGGIAVDYSGKTRCCGFPILTMNEKASYAMAGDHLVEAKQEGADVMVTPLPPMPPQPGRRPTQGRPTEKGPDRPPHHPPPPDARPILRHPPPRSSASTATSSTPRASSPKSPPNPLPPMPPTNVNVESLTREIEQLQKLLREEGAVHNEVNTRRAFVDPLLKALGWSDRSIYSEYTVNYSGSFYGEARRKVDYALHEPGDLGALIAFIEAKRVSNDLSDEHRTQIRNYAQERDVRRFVLTNGDQWELYEKGKSSPIVLSIRKQSASDCAHLLLEHFPRLSKPEPVQIVAPPIVPASMTSESDALPSAPIVPSHPTSKLPQNVDFPKTIAWFAVSLVAFGILGWAYGVWTAEPIDGFFELAGLFGVVIIMILALLLVRRLNLSIVPVFFDVLRLHWLFAPIDGNRRKTLIWVTLATICGIAAGGVGGYFIGLQTGQAVVNALEALGLIVVALAIFFIAGLLVDSEKRRRQR